MRRAGIIDDELHAVGGGGGRDGVERPTDLLGREPAEHEIDVRSGAGGGHVFMLLSRVIVVIECCARLWRRATTSRRGRSARRAREQRAGKR